MSRKSRYNRRIIPAYHFRPTHLGDEEIEGFVNDILQTIEDDVYASVEEERNKTITQIPTFFTVTGMDNARAQRHVYYHVLKALKQNGYIPRIEIVKQLAQTQSVYIHTTWITQDDRDLEALMDKFVIAHQINRPQSYKHIQEENQNSQTAITSRRRRP